MLKPNELEHGKIYKVTREVLRTWSPGDLFRCDRTTAITRLILLKYKRLNARSIHSNSREFEFVMAALETSES